MNIQFNKGVLELCILSVLTKNDYSGYDLLKKITKIIKIPEGSFYPLLNQLSRGGYIDTYYIESNNTSKKFYKITATGLDEKIKLHDRWDSLTSRVDYLLKEDISNE